MQIGIDVGGTKIEAIGLEGNQVIAPPRRLPTPRDYTSTITAIVQLVQEIETVTERVGSIGIGIPGTISRATGLVKNANSVWLNGRALQQDLEASLRRPLRIANDANCFALSEAVDGAGCDSQMVFGVILGTGVGGGIAMSRQIHEGPNQIAGEWGHNPLPWMTAEEQAQKRPCYCGKDKCIETFLSGPGFEQDYTMLSARHLSSRQIVEAAAQHDGHALSAIKRYEDRLARALASVINLLDPNIVVLGGGMSHLPQLPAGIFGTLQNYVFSDAVITPIALNVHGDSSGVRGAAWLWPAPSRH